jgi:hypothetical protein
MLMNKFFLSIAFALSFVLSGYSSYYDLYSYQKEKEKETEKALNNIFAWCNKWTLAVIKTFNSFFPDNQDSDNTKNIYSYFPDFCDEFGRKMKLFLARSVQIYEGIPPENIWYGSAVGILAMSMLCYVYYSKKISARCALIAKINSFIQQAFFCLPEMKIFLKKNTVFFENILKERGAQQNNTFGDGFSSDVIVKAFESVLSYADLAILRDYLTIKKLVEKHNSSFLVKKINFGEIVISICLQEYQAIL